MDPGVLFSPSLLPQKLYALRTSRALSPKPAVDARIMSCHIPPRSYSFIHFARKALRMSTAQIRFALDFPQGHILFIENSGAYFLPRHSMDAFQVWGERKELFGKHAISVREDRSAQTQAYNVVYEFSDSGALTDARLISKDQTVRGTLADQDTLNSLNGALAQKALTLYTQRDTEPDSVFNAARFADGRLLIQLMNRNELYIGTPGNFTKVDAQLYVQGGNSMYYRTPEGEQIDLPYGFGGPRHGEIPTFKGEPLIYIDTKDGNPAQFGLDLARGVKHLNPFSPELVSAHTPRPPQPKP